MWRLLLDETGDILESRMVLAAFVLLIVLVGLTLFGQNLAQYWNGIVSKLTF